MTGGLVWPLVALLDCPSKEGESCWEEATFLDKGGRNVNLDGKACGIQAAWQ